MLFFFVSLLATFYLFSPQCSAENVTSVNQLVFALSGNNASHAYDDVFGSVIAADNNAITVHLDCRPSPSPSSCTDQDATITAGPSTLVYTSSSGTFYAYLGCSKTVEGGDFVCSYHNHKEKSKTLNTVGSSFRPKIVWTLTILQIVSHRGPGGYAPMQITAGIEKLTNAPVPTMTESGTTKSLDANGRNTWTMLWGSLGITFLISTVFG